MTVATDYSDVQSVQRPTRRDPAAEIVEDLDRATAELGALEQDLRDPSVADHRVMFDRERLLDLVNDLTGQRRMLSAEQKELAA